MEFFIYLIHFSCLELHLYALVASAVNICLIKILDQSNDRRQSSRRVHTTGRPYIPANCLAMSSQDIPQSTAGFKTAETSKDVAEKESVGRDGSPNADKVSATKAVTGKRLGGEGMRRSCQKRLSAE